MLKIAKTIAICTFALFCTNAAAQDISQDEAAPAAAVEESAPSTNESDTVSADQNDAKSNDSSSENQNSAETETTTAADENRESSGSDNDNNSSNTSDNQDSASSPNASDDQDSANSPDAVILTDALLDKQIREVSTNLDTLKEDTFTTKSRLLLLREEVLQRSVSGSRILLRHKNDMGGQYELIQVYYAIDRTPIFYKQESDGSLNKLDDEVLYDHLVAPGSHQINVLYVYKGKKWGIFNYMKSYTFRVESGYDFIIDEGKAAELIITASEQGGAFTPYEQRPSVKFDYQQYDLIPGSTSGDESTDANTDDQP